MPNRAQHATGDLSEAGQRATESFEQGQRVVHDASLHGRVQLLTQSSLRSAAVGQVLPDELGALLLGWMQVSKDARRLVTMPDRWVDQNRDALDEQFGKRLLSERLDKLVLYR